MEVDYSIVDSRQLLEAASEFANYPGVQNDAAAREFLDRFPLPVIISALQTGADVAGLEHTLVNCLERIFRTKYGASLISDYMPFVVVGLKAASPEVRSLSCKIVSCLLAIPDDPSVSAVKLIVDNNVYPLLLDCLINGDERVAAASMDTIKTLTCLQEGVGIVFPADDTAPTHLGNLAAQCTSLGRVRVLALIVKLFAISISVASTIYNFNLLNFMEAEIRAPKDTLVTLSVLELLYEMAEIQHGTEILSRTSLLQLLSSIISNELTKSLLRTRAIMICGRLLSRDAVYMILDESTVRMVISAISGRLMQSESLDLDECESSVEALGQIGLYDNSLDLLSQLSILDVLESSPRQFYKQTVTYQALYAWLTLAAKGAALLLSGPSPVAKYLVNAAFDKQGRGRQLAGLHSLANLSGVDRPESSSLLDSSAEEGLRFLIYETASRSSKLTPSGIFLSVVQQDPEVRVAAYRALSALVLRPWCLVEICSREEIIDIVTDPSIETTKIGMEVRHNCCQAIYKALTSSVQLANDPSLAGITTKLQEAVRRGPYLARKHPEAQPAVMTAERF